MEAPDRAHLLAKEWERQLGVTDKTAWRMVDLIRKPTANIDVAFLLLGEIEARRYLHHRNPSGHSGSQCWRRDGLLRLPRTNR